MFRLWAVGGMRTRAGYIKPAELFRYLADILAAHHVENKEKQKSFCKKMHRDKAQASNAPNSDPESWEEFKQMLPEELTQTLAGQEFCRFVCDIETDTEEDTDAVNEELVQQGMVVFASVDARERLIKSPNWLLGGELKTFSIFKQVRIFSILRFPLLYWILIQILSWTALCLVCHIPQWEVFPLPLCSPA